MSFKGRAVRIALAVGVAGLLSAQMPTGVALADDTYTLGGGNGARLPIEIGVAALVGYGVYSTLGPNGQAAPAPVPGGDTNGAGGAPPIGGAGTDQGIWDVANGNADLQDFATAADAAGLKPTLQDNGSYTVFAPTHEAFAALPAGTLTSLETPANQSALKALLSAHIVPGQRLTIAQLKVLPGATADPGAPLTALTGQIYVKYSAGASATDPGNLAISTTPFGAGNETGTTVTQTDITARNGIMHPISAVLQPPTTPTTPPATQ